MLSSNLSAQPWLQATYQSSQAVQKKQQGDDLNFYDLQQGFNNFWQSNPITKGCGYKEFKRFEELWGPRLYPTGVFPDENELLKSYGDAINYGKNSAQFKMSSSASVFSSSWKTKGPFNTAPGNFVAAGVGRVTSIAFHPTDATILFAGASSGGVWKSTNGGNSWSNLNTDFLPTLSVGDIVVNSSNPDIIFISTGTGDAVGQGIYKSTDGGISWNNIYSYNSSLQSLTGRNYSNRLIMNPSNNNILLCVTFQGIIKTTDGGATWTQSSWFYPPTNSMITGGSCTWTDIKFKPGDPNIVYATIHNGCTAAAVYQSTDGGSTFQRILDLPATVGYSKLAVSPANPSTIYCLTEILQTGAFQGLYKSTDNGSTWNLMSSSPDIVGGAGWYTMAILVSPTNVNEIYVGGVNQWKSLDGGTTWNQISTWYGSQTLPFVHADVWELEFAPGTSKLYSCNDGGVYVSPDNGATWSELNNGLAITQFYRLADSEIDTSLVVLGANDNGSFKFNGTNFYSVTFGDGMDNMVDFNNPDIIYTSTQLGNFHKSTDGGITTVPIKPISGDGAWVTPCAMKPSDPKTIFLAYQDVFMSANRGIFWTQISNNLTGGVNIENIAIDNQGNTIYAATLSNLFKTNNGGSSWTNISNGLPVSNAAISGIFTHPSNSNNVWVTFSGYSNGQKVYFSSDGGLNWTNISGALPNIPANCIVLDLSSSDNTLYLGMDVGVYLRNDSINDWVSFNSGLPNARIRDLDINYRNNVLRAATYGRGLWETPISVLPSAPATAPCKKVNFPVPLAGYYWGQNYGYVFGHNTDKVADFADYIVPDGSYSHVMGARFNFHTASTLNSSTSKITAILWKNDGPNGEPGTIIASKDLMIQQIVTDIGNGEMTDVYFNSPVPATQPYYLGFEIYHNITTDTVAVKNSAYGAIPVNNAWYKPNNVWREISSYWGNQYRTSLAVYPLAGNIPTPDFTVNSAAACPGNTLNFTNTTTNGNSFSWTFAGGTPDDSTYAINPSVTYYSSGTYNVKLVAYGSCNGVDSLTKVNYINISTPTLNANITNASCNGNSNGAIDLSVTGAGTYSYLWSNGATTQDVNGLSQGSYTVTVSIGACSSTATFIVTQPAILSATSAIVNVNCNGTNTGSIDLSVTGGTIPYSYLWSNNSTAQDISGLTAATYSVTVTDSKGCTSVHSKTITQPSAVTATTSVTNASCGSNNGAINLTVGGGTTPYTFNWSNNATTEDISSLGAGSLTVTVTDNKGCIKTASATVISPGSPGITVTAVTNVSCNGGSNGAIDITPSGGATPYTFNWSNSAITQDVNYLAAGTYTITVTDAAFCSYNTSINVSQPTTINVSVSNQTNVSCNGGNNGSASLTINGGTAPFTYIWSNGATAKDIVNLSAGTYNVTVTSTGGCTATASATISQPGAFSSSVKTIANVSCNGSSDGAVDINVSGGVSPLTYIWNNNANTQDITNVAAGTYSVTVTDKNGCTSALNASVIQPIALSATILKTNANCYGGNNGSTSLTVNGGTSPYTYLWNTGATSASLSGLLANPYAETVTDSKNCTAYQSVSITQPDSLTIAIISQSNVSCNGGNNGAVNISVSGGITPYSYAWSNGSVSEDVNGLSAGSYIVTVTAPAGCSKTKQFSITQPAVVSVSDNVVTQVTCNGGNNGAIDVNVTGGTSPYSYYWSNGASTQDIAGLSANSYSVTVTGIGGCSSVFQKTISQPAPIAISVFVTNSTCGSNNGAIDITASGGITPYTYTWSTGATSQDIASLAAGDYSVTVTDANNCIKTKTSTVTQPSALSVGITSVNNVSCNGGNNGAINITPSGGSTPYTFNWSNSATTEDISSLNAGTYSVTVTDASSCSYITSANVSQPAVLTASITSQTNVSCNGGNNGSIDLSVSGGTAPFSYNWSNAAIVQDPTGLSAGTYSVTVTGTGGCTANASVIISESPVISVSSAITNVTHIAVFLPSNVKFWLKNHFFCCVNSKIHV